jgi:Fur family ferric uptake transcriptional regulator
MAEISKIEKLCNEKNIKLTQNRKIIAKIISDSDDHPDTEEIFLRATKINPNIGIATVYRALKMFGEIGVIARHDFGTGKTHYEKLEDDHHHDHLIDVTNSKVIEFFDQELEDLKIKVAKRLGYELVDHKLELYATPIEKPKK